MNNHAQDMAETLNAVIKLLFGNLILLERDIGLKVERETV